MQRGRVAEVAHRGNKIEFGDFAIQALGHGFITNKQIEAAHVFINRHMKRRGKMWIRIFPDKPITKKPLETRMGKGKGATEGWVAPVQAGRVLFEVAGINEATARGAFMRAANKLPVRCKMIVRPGAGEI